MVFLNYMCGAHLGRPEYIRAFSGHPELVLSCSEIPQLLNITGDVSRFVRRWLPRVTSQRRCLYFSSTRLSLNSSLKRLVTV